MASATVHPVLRFIRRLTETAPAGEPADAALLARFVGRRDEAAFAALLQRHGPMVYGVCRRVLGDSPDADDAFQATFLVFVRKAGSVSRPELLGNWLYGVAHRTALKARAGVARRRAELHPLPEVAVADPTEEAVWRDLRPVLDEELSRLPDKYRTAVVLCDLEGRTHEEAAQSLGCPRETVTTRLTRARARLRGRLLQRGLTLSGGLLAAVLAEQAAPAAVPAGLEDLTRQAALRFAAGQAAGVVSSRVAALTGGVLQAMFWNHLIRMTVVVLGLGLMGTGAGLVGYRVLSAEPGQGQGQTATGEGAAKKAESPAEDPDQLQGTWKIVQAEWTGHADLKRVGETWVVTGNQVAVQREGPKVEYTFKLDRTTDPHHVDLAPTEKSEVGYHYRGIYRVEKDRLTICATVVRKGETSEKVRPTAFATKTGDLRILWVLERHLPLGKPGPYPEKGDVQLSGTLQVEGPPQAGNEAKEESDQKKLQGTWQAVSGEENGQPLTDDFVKNYKATFAGNRVKLTAIDDSGTGTIKLDPKQNPKTIDIHIKENEEAIGIYEVTGDTLKLCMVEAKPGNERPTEFVGKGQQILIVFKRTKADKK
jgi:RNA polymerase sigma factor (sigma-70 family)